MRIITAIIVLLFGLALTIGGAMLVRVGGSPFYVASGIALLLVAFGIWRNARWALPLYSIWLIALLAWSLWESGLYWWPLAARVGVPALLGLWLAWMTARRGTSRVGSQVMFGHAGRTTPHRAATRWTTLASVVVVAVAFAGMLRHPREINDALDVERVTNAPNLGDRAPPPGDWHAWGRTGFGQRYSPLEQIDANNVKNLKLAWHIQTGDVRRPDDVPETTYQVTPLKVGDTLYLCTPHDWVLALDADTGKERWHFKPDVPAEPQRQHQTCRGVSYFATSAAPIEPNSVEAQAASPTCSARLFLPTADAKLYALDAQTGKLCSDFGDLGVLDLMHNMPFRQSGYYYSTSPPVVADGRVVVAGAVNDNYAVDEPSGVIRAYDAMTGRLLWNWDSGNPDSTQPFDPANAQQKYTTSSPNSWSVASVDEKLGLVYFPMGNREPDQLGYYRNAAEEKYSSSVVALDLVSGRARWVHQFVHHDLWDMDTPAQPSLIDLDMPSGKKPALVVPTKQGDVYVLDRRDGSALLPVAEHPAPQGGQIPEQNTAPTQPRSALSFEPAPLRESDMWGATLIDQMLCRIQFRKLRYEGRYTPPSLPGSIIYPGNFGTFNWGGIAVDPERQVMFGMPTYLAFVSTLIPRSELGEATMNVGEQGINENRGAAYAVQLKPLMSPLNVPCQQPPWGTIAAADLRTGKVAYQYRNGTVRDMSPIPVPLKLGVPGLGGPLILRSGVVFLAAAVDNDFRAYDLASGDVKWDVRIPAGGQATPMTYLDSQGRQIVLLVAGGHGSLKTTPGDHVLAYRLQ